jgi:hypothetical protein
MHEQRRGQQFERSPLDLAMIILGFAGIGFMAYRRNSKPALMAA